MGPFVRRCSALMLLACTGFAQAQTTAPASAGAAGASAATPLPAPPSVLPPATRGTAEPSVATRPGDAAPGDAAAQGLPWTSAKVRRVDAANGRITLRHEAMPHLDMPAMTMAFELRNPQDAQGLAEGDALQVQVRREGSRYLVEALRPEAAR